MTIFISHFKRPRLVFRTYKTDRDGNVTQEPVYVLFEDGVFQTEDQQIADFIKSRPNFGADYWEVSEIPAGKGYQGSKVGVAKMDSPTQQIEQKDAEVEQLRGQVSELTKLVKELLESKTEATSENKTKKKKNEETSEEAK